MRSSFILTGLLLASLCAAPASAVVVHGMEHTALGGATITINGSGFARSLELNDLGSSGNDGVSMALGGAPGVSLLEVPQINKSKIIHRDLACRVFDNGLLTVAAQVSETVTPSGLMCVLQTPGSQGDVEVTAYRLGIVIYASKRGYDYYQNRGVLRTNFAVLLSSDTTRSSLVLDEQQTPSGIERTAVHTVQFRAPEPVVIDDQTFVADRIVVRAPIATSNTRCVDAQLRFTGGGGGGGAGGITIDEAGQSRPRKGPKSNHRALDVHGLGNVVLGPVTADPQGGLMQDVTLPIDGSGNQAMLSINGLPPGEPIIRRGFTSIDLPMDPAGLTLPVGGFVRTRIVVMKDGDGGITERTHQLQVLRAGQASYAYSASSNDPNGSVRFALHRGPRQTTSLEGTRVLFANFPHMHQIGRRLADGRARIGFATPGGVTADGLPYDCDSVVVCFDPAVPSNDASIRELRLSASPGTTIRLRGGLHAEQAGSVQRWGPLAVRADGDARLDVQPDGSVAVSDLSASQGSGLTWDVTGSSSLRLSFPGGLSVADTLPGLRLDLTRCPDGTCAALSSFELTPTADPLVMRLRIAGTNGPVFLGAEPALEPAALLEGLPGVEIVSLNGLPPALEKLPIRWSAPESIRARLLFTGPVAYRISTSQPKIIENKKGLLITFDTAPSGGSGAQPTAVSLNGLPPGEPILRRARFSIGEPGVQVAGADVGETGLDPIRMGVPVSNSWAAVRRNPAAGVEMEPDLVVIAQGDVNGDGTWDVTRKRVTSDSITVIADDTDEDCDGSVDRTLGFVVDTGLGASTMGDTTRASFALDGWSGGGYQEGLMTLTVTGAPGGHASLGLDASSLTSTLECRAYSNGALVRTFPYAGHFDASQPPSRYKTSPTKPDTDGDGIAFALGFPLGTTVTANGAVFACDSMTFSPPPPAKPTPWLTNICHLRVGLNGLPPGVPVPLRIATIDGQAPTVGVTPGAAALQFGLRLVSANPSRGETRLRFALPQSANVRVSVHDLLGRELRVLADQRYAAGEHVLAWDGRTASETIAPAGMYFVRVQRDGQDTRSVKLLKLQ